MLGSKRRVLGIAAASTVAAAILLTAAVGRTPAGQSPDTLVDHARPGQTIRLPAGTTGTLTIASRQFERAITIDASQARLTAVIIRDSRGVKLAGGAVVGTGGKSYGIHIVRSRDIEISGLKISGAHRGIVIDASTGIRITNNNFFDLISDGLDIALSHQVMVSGNSCRNFHPRPRIYDSAGVLIKDGDHADCIQAWSRPSAAPTSDIQVIGNYAEGEMQGVFFGNHVRNGIDDGGFDRITIKDNQVRLAIGNGIHITDGRDSIIEGNKVYTIPGATFRKGLRDIPVKVNLSLIRGTTKRFCGNFVEAMPNAPGQQSC